MTALNILHVDDEDDIREVAAFALALDPDIVLTSVASGQAALAALDEGLRPDVVLLDVMMPNLDGPGTLVRIRERAALENTPVIFYDGASAIRRNRSVSRLGGAGRRHQAL